MTLPDDVAIRAHGLSKKYRLFDSARDRLLEALDPWGRTRHRDFWALKDIDLAIPKGQTVGILGRNGSGKSTLLQILTSVLQPTTGTLEVQGRIAALLELGAGFDPDFSGRDNVRQFGRLQGLKPNEIEARLPEIEGFAYIGEFFDRPVKTYSSGMFARLAFAAAINVDPDILILDEILAVGDARFQQRCLRRIQELNSQGTTVLFVSHNTDQVLRLCNQAALLEGGHLVQFGPTPMVVDGYHQMLYGSGSSMQIGLPVIETKKISAPEAETLPPAIRDFLHAREFELASRPYYNSGERRLGTRDSEIVDVIALVNDCPPSGSLEGKEDLTLFIKVHYKIPIGSPRIGWGIVSTEGIMVSGSNSVSRGIILPDASPGEIAVYRIDIQLNLCTGDYFLNLGVSTYDNPDWHFLDSRRAVLHFNVKDSQGASGFVDLPSQCHYCASTHWTSLSSEDANA
jgi:homopolymeric O-antigen transport system ATP-binding protein